VNKTVGAAQLANCILFHAYSRTTASFQLREHKKKTSYSLFNALA